MTVALWRIAANTAQYVANDLSGTGAKNTGGRWNPIGIAVTYTSENISLAVHETIVHLRSGGLPLSRYLVRVDVPNRTCSLTPCTPMPRASRQLPHASGTTMRGTSNITTRGSYLDDCPR